MQIMDNIQNLINRYNQISTQRVLDEVKPILRDSIVGQEIKGEILKIMTQSTLLLLDDGSEITVSGNVPSNAKEGQIMNIKVEEKTNQGSVKAKVISIEEPEHNKMDMIKSCFKELDISVSEENLKIAKQMIKEHIDITPDNVKFIFAQCLKTDKLNSEEIMFLLKNGIDINEDNVEIFSNFIRKNNFILDDLNSLIDKLDDSKKFNDETYDLQLEEPVEYHQEEIDNTSNDTKLNTESTKKYTFKNPINENDEKIEFFSKRNDLNEVNLEEDNNLENVKNNLVANNIEDDNYSNGHNVNKNSSNYDSDVSIKDESEETRNLTNSDKDVIKKDGDKKEYLTFKTVVKNNTENEKILSSKQNSIKNIFKNLSEKKEPGKEIEQKKIVREVLKAIDEENNIISKNGINKDVSKNIEKIKKNIIFLNSINKYNNAFQIPLNVNNERTMAELYVFNGDANKSDKKINENNYTMFFTLGTANLGNVEAYVRVVNKTVECNFVSSKSEVAQLIDENKEELVNMTNAYGFKLIKVTSTIGEKDINLLTAINENKKNIEKNNFDIKV